MSEHSKACCTIPPVDGGEYSAQGKYETVESRKTYITGPADATKAIIFIFDIFGFYPQTLRGADILANSGTDDAHKYLVVVPDWFKGKPADISWYPPQTDEAKAKLDEFFQGPANPKLIVPEIPKVIAAIEKEYPSIKEWIALGYCWGGKMITLAGGNDTGKFKAIAQVHPAMVAPEDGKKLKVPLLSLASGDENYDDVQQLTKNAPAGSDCKLYEKSVHGWMAARADLSDPEQQKTYRDGYADVLDFFSRVVT